MKVVEDNVTDNPPYVYIDAVWKDIYDPTTVSVSYAKIEIEAAIFTLDAARVNQYWKWKLDDVIHMLWDHELHEYLKFDDEYLHHPHPEGRDGPLG